MLFTEKVTTIYSQHKKEKLMEWKIPSMTNDTKGEFRYARKRKRSNEENERNNPSATRRERHIDTRKKENNQDSETNLPLLKDTVPEQMK